MYFFIDEKLIIWIIWWELDKGVFRKFLSYDILKYNFFLLYFFLVILFLKYYIKFCFFCVCLGKYCF